MIQERQLAAAMKRAYSGGGYEVVGYTDKFYIAKPAEWAVLIPRKLTGRKVLAALAEHIGEIPSGTAWSVSKARDAQMMTPEMAAKNVEKLRKICTGGKYIVPTLLAFNGIRVWQTVDGKPVLVPGYSVMAPEDTDANYIDGAVSWNDGNCLLMVAESSAEMPSELRDALADIQISRK